MMNPTLFAGLLLPWITGSLWLAAVRRYQAHVPHAGRLPRLLGYGFFLGYALLYALIIAVDGLLGRVNPAIVLTSLAVLATLGLGLLLWMQRRRPGATLLPPHNDGNGGSHGLFERVLTWVLLGWMAIHLLFTLADVLSMPVYAWDAWVVWLYRAKAWFYSGGLTEVVSPQLWADATGAPPYTVDAYAYPTFVSVIGFWVALCLGKWSETLVNLPGFLCGIAIGLALYGHIARLGLAAVFAAAAVYLLYSTPLFGAHLSLGGYADIWMAGYAGLGFVSLLNGLAHRERDFLALGLLLLAFSTQVKSEGLVWLLASLVLLAALALPARIRWLTIGLLAIAAGAFLAGVSHVELPLIGTFGYMDGHLYIPLVGAYPVQANAVWDEYLTNFFALGSWNLLWLLVAGAMAAAWRRPIERPQRTALAFLLVFIATQAAIFGFSEQGQWAERFTAINRLPLQFMPALLFACALVARPWLRKADRSERGERLRMPWLAVGTATAVVAIGAVLFLSSRAIPGTEQSVEPEWRFVMGSGQISDGMLTVERFQQSRALVSSGATRFAASDYPMLRIELDTEPIGDPALRPAFFWRRADQPEDVTRITLDGTVLRELTNEDGWSGQITEIGLLFNDTGGAPRVRRLALERPGLGNQWELALQGWLQFEPWSLRSVNFIWGGSAQQPLHLPVLVLAWVVLAMLLVQLPGFRPGRQPAAMALVLLAGWLLLDARWTLNGARQFAIALERGMVQPADELLVQLPDSEVYDFIARFHARRPPDEPRRILVVGDKDEHGYYLDRARYHLLPDSAQVAWELDDRFSPTNIDYVLFVGEIAGRSWAETWRQLPLGEEWRDDLNLADSGEMAILFSVEK
jgi:hypothetical protein